MAVLFRQKNVGRGAGSAALEQILNLCARDQELVHEIWRHEEVEPVRIVEIALDNQIVLELIQCTIGRVNETFRLHVLEPAHGRGLPDRWRNDILASAKTRVVISQLVTREPSPTSAPATNAPATNVPATDAPTTAPTIIPTDVPATTAPTTVPAEAAPAKPLVANPAAPRPAV